jgi:hypothetical protein
MEDLCVEVNILLFIAEECVKILSPGVVRVDVVARGMLVFFTSW